MKKYLLPKDGQFYKANLHCHTTVSDGHFSPKQVKEAYVSRGYSVIAFTDHDVMIPHSELADEHFLPLNGYEMEVARNRQGTSTCHMCLIALDPDNLTQVCFHREKYIGIGNAAQYRDRVKFDETLPDYEREYTPEKISEMMQMGRDGGFFVTYNHPNWSIEGPEQYLNYHGMHAMEIHNTDCLSIGYPDYNEKEYDQMLRGGERIFCIATDDNHNKYPLNSRRSDSFGGWTMIKAEKLDYKAITDALVAGHFYASEGPEIYDLWLEHGKIHITCSDADRIILSGSKRKAQIAYAEDGKPLNEAVFEVDREQQYLRVTVMDADGRHANTNAYFADEWLT